MQHIPLILRHREIAQQPAMSIPFLLVALIILLLVVGLSFYLDRRYRISLTSVEEKSAGWRFYYRGLISGLFNGDLGRDQILAALHYVASHLLTPIAGLGLALRTDGNFLVVIFSVLISMQLVQRLYPGSPEYEDDEWDEIPADDQPGPS